MMSRVKCGARAPARAIWNRHRPTWGQPPAVRRSEAPLSGCSKSVELRSTGQPRAAVPTWLVVIPARAGRSRPHGAVPYNCNRQHVSREQNTSGVELVSDHGDTIATLAGRPLISNRGIPLNLDWLQQVRVNTSAVERRAQSHVARRTVKKDWQAAWLLRAVSCMDLTTLSGDDTEERVRRLCAKARHPIQDDLVKRLGIEELNIKVAAVCVYHTFVETAVRALEGSGVRVAAVSTGFPAGLSPLTERVAEIRRSVEAGANDIDVVITRAHVFGGKWQALYDEIAAFKQASGSAHMKVILGAGDLLTLRNVARASLSP